MARVLALPFQLGPDGTAVKVEQQSDTGEAQVLAALALTRPGEIDLAPTFGCHDPLFASLSQAELASGASTFGPFVDVQRVQSVPIGPGTTRIEISFE